MKKNKLVGLSALLLSIGMVGCGEVEPCAEHDWGDYVETLAATCTAAGSKERTCKVCNEKETKETAKKSHTWTTVSETNSTCTVQGVKKEKCSVCGEEKETKKSLAAHTYGDTVWTQEADCLNGGVGTKTCTACEHVEDVTVDALGHEETKDEEKSVAPTCLKSGKDVMHCSRCGNDREVPVEKIGHEYELVGEAGVRDGDYAAVNMYQCKNGCEETAFGFEANEVTSTSGRTVTGDYGGQRFWGRPIGNNMELDDNGTATARPEDLTAVFDETVQGDLFEYKFKLTAEQVAAIGDEAICWCDAKPADYLNGKDFWAADPNGEEYTPGMYIDGEKKGQEITDYRYILYFNGDPVSFDETMKSPVTAVDPSSSQAKECKREEFAIPYVFHLLEGENSISLRMAGGYRSEFYKFTFRAKVEEEPVDPEQIPEEGIAMTSASIVEKDGKPYLKVGGNTAQTAETIAAYAPFINFQNVNDWANYGHDNTNDPTDIPFEWDTATANKAYILIDISALAVGGNYNTHLNMVEKLKKDCKLTTAIDETYKVGDVEYEIVSIPGSTLEGNAGFWGNLGIRVKDGSAFAETAAKTALNADGKTVSQYTTTLGQKQRIAINVTDYSSKDNVKEEKNGTVKLNKNGSLTYKINCDLPDTTDNSGNAKAQTVKAKLVIGDKPGSPDHVKCHLFNDYFIPDEVKAAVPDIVGSTLGTPDTEDQDAWRIHVTVNGVEVPVTNYKTLGEMGLESGKIGYIELCDVTLVNGENTIVVKQGNIGYSFVFGGELRLEWDGTNTIVMDAPTEIPEVPAE